VRSAIYGNRVYGKIKKNFQKKIDKIKYMLYTQINLPLATHKIYLNITYRIFIDLIYCVNDECQTYLYINDNGIVHKIILFLIIGGISWLKK
jgi:hypothetical protein